MLKLKVNIYIAYIITGNTIFYPKYSPAVAKAAKWDTNTYQPKIKLQITPINH